MATTSNIRGGLTLLPRHLWFLRPTYIRLVLRRAALSTLSPRILKSPPTRTRGYRRGQYHLAQASRTSPVNYSTPKPLSSSQSTRPSEISESTVRSVLLRSPTAHDLEERELDAELIPKDKINVFLTERAAEQLRRISTREGNSDIALRISVESGGCHGYQYKMGLVNECAPEDYCLAHPDIRPSNLHIDAVSLPMLNGSTVDYAIELIGSSFRVSGNPQAKGGCGCGVSWELND